jgi:hypothetical protein
MRDLGTPIYGRKLFEVILTTFPRDAEIGALLDGSKPIAVALLLHGNGITEVPTASSLREYNASSANVLTYRRLLDRAVERGQLVFDFGRSTADGPTFKSSGSGGPKSTRRRGSTPCATARAARCGRTTRSTSGSSASGSASPSASRKRSAPPPSATSRERGLRRRRETLRLSRSNQLN